MCIIINIFIIYHNIFIIIYICIDLIYIYVLYFRYIELQKVRYEKDIKI